ncbi:MAG: glycosyltransferase, partial [Candidatus Margulisiibacteriota bacterium]
LISGSLTVNLYAALAKILSFSKTRIILGVHSIISELKESGGITFSLLPLLSRLTYWAAYKVIAASNFAAEDFSKTTGIPRTRIDVIYNPVPIEDITKESLARFEHRFFSTGHPPVIISVGRIEKEKNFPLLLEAFSIVRKHRDVKLLIVGEGSQRNMLIEKAKELNISNDVDMPGFSSNPYPLMRRSSVFVLSSNHESFGIVLVEAMALGLSIVATDCPGGIREVLENGKYGIISPKADAKAMADAIEKALDTYHDGMLSKMRALDFSVEKISDQYLELFGKQR